MTNEERTKLIRHLKYNRSIGADYLITDEDVDEIIKALEKQPCEDCISRETLLEELGEEPFNWNDSPEEYQEVSDYQWFKSLVENAPSVTPQPKVGKWIAHPKSIYAHLVCNKCLSSAPYDCKTNYCPNCGAKMEVEK